MEEIDYSISNGDNITTTYRAVNYVSYQHYYYKRILTIYSDEYLKVFPNSKKETIRWTVRYRNTPNSMTDYDFIDVSTYEHEILEKVFTIMKRKQKVERIKNAIRR